METGVKTIWGGEMVVNLLPRDWTMASPASAHLMLFSAFGIWLWFTIHRFGNCEPFTKFTTLSIFVPTPVTSQYFRIGSIVIYIIGLVPFIDIVVLVGLEFLVVVGCQKIIARIRKHKSLKSSPLESQEHSSHKSPEPDRELLHLFIALTFALLVLPLRQVWKEARKLKAFKRLFGDPKDLGLVYFQMSRSNPI